MPRIDFSKFPFHLGLYPRLHRCMPWLMDMVFVIPRISATNMVVAGKRKCWLRRFVENTVLRTVDREPCLEYNALGIDKKGRRIFDYIRRGRNHNQRVMGHNQTGWPDFGPVLFDKYLFWLYAKSLGLPVIPVLARSSRDSGFLVLDKASDLNGFIEFLRTQASFFVKDEAHWCGMGCRKVRVVDGEFIADGRVLDLASLAKEMDFIVQPNLHQGEFMNLLNPSSVNTIRIVTCWTRDGAKTEMLCPAVMRIGRHGSSIDNFTAGGVCVGIEDDGRLKTTGFSHDENFNYQTMEQHPDGHYRFANMKIPDYSAVQELAVSAHRNFRGIKTIGWDIALSDHGWIIVEANPGWGPMIMEAAHQTPLGPRLSEIGL